jgi:hypothetical protein
MTLSPTKGRELLGAVTAATTYNETGEAAVALLNFLLRQLEELRELANGYPRNPISGNVWVDGKALAELCDDLTELLSARQLPEQEELASRIATGMACQVMGHYPEEIFPRVVRNARCREKIDQVDNAIGSYEAVIGDFRELDLQYLLEEDETLDNSGRTILTAVLHATVRLTELGSELAELHSFKATLEQRLARQS